MFGSVDGRIRGTKPRSSEDDIFSSTAHDVEEMFLGDPFNVSVEGASVTDHTSFVCSLVNIANHDRGGEFLGRQSMLLDELPVNVGDVHTRIY